jgi:hypothetical protein
MGSHYQLLLGGQPADAALYTLVASIEVEESMDTPAAVEITVPVAYSGDGDLSYVNDARFAPMAQVAVVASASDGGSSAQCIFDGYVLSQKLHLETGVTNATLAVWGQDACWLMNQTERVKEWVDMTDSQVAADIFGDYGITPADDNGQDDSPSHTEDGHSLMQRGSDIAFLRQLARRTGKVCRVACADKPGQRTGYFAPPKLDGDPAVSFALNDPANWTIRALDIEWDATRPTAVTARAALFTDASSDGASGDSSDSGLKTLGDRALGDFTGSTTTVLLAATVDDAGELTQRAQGVLRETGWFARCEGEADVERVGQVLRAGMLVALAGIGAAHSGAWLVWAVRHRLTQEAHLMNFTLLRNAVGKPPSGGAGGLAALAGAI